jgi:hypothetical protein
MAVSWCIQVYNTASPLSTQDSSYLASQMQAKAQLDLANVISSVDFVIESWSDDNGNWYRKYRSGWIEQGGYTTQNTASATISLFVEMANIKYGVNLATNNSATSTDTDGAAYCPAVSDKTVIGFRVTQPKSANDSTYWQISGYYAK